MRQYRFDDGKGVSLSSDGVGALNFSAAPSPPPPPPPPGDIEVAVLVDFVDASGAILSVNPLQESPPTISGVAPFFLHIDASGTRFPAAFAAQEAIADPEAFAFLKGGSRINYGEALGGTWPFPEGQGASRDEDLGPPIFGRVFTTPGNHLVRLRHRDTLGSEVTVSWTVSVSAPAAPTIIETSAGAWPTWVNGTHYGLRADGNYWSFGAMDFREKHNIIVSKVGEGADPIVSQFRPDGRTVINAPEAEWLLARGIRLIDIDVGEFAESGVQFVHCGVVRGRCRTWGSVTKAYYYDNDTTNANTRASVRYPRGAYLWDTGTMNRGGSNYVMVGGARHRHLVGVDFEMNGPVGASVAALRLYDHESMIRHSRIANTYQDGGMQVWLSMLGLGDIGTYPTYSPQPWTDQVGEADTDALILPIPRKFVAHQCQFGQAGQPWPNAPGSIGGPSNEAWVSEMFGWEKCVVRLSEPTDYPNSDSVNMTGRYHFLSDVKYGMGAGGSVAVSSADGPDAAFNGPRLIESTSTRPVPTPF